MGTSFHSRDPLFSCCFLDIVYSLATRPQNVHVLFGPCRSLYRPVLYTGSRGFSTRAFTTFHSQGIHVDGRASSFSVLRTELWCIVAYNHPADLVAHSDDQSIRKTGVIDAVPRFVTNHDLLIEQETADFLALLPKEQTNHVELFSFFSGRRPVKLTKNACDSKIVQRTA
jgi:hypothetical protein